MKNNLVWQKINIFYGVVLCIVGAIWIAQIHTFGIFMGLAAIVIAYFVYQKNRWSYFAAAVLYFGLLRIAMDDGHDFHQGLQSIGKLAYLINIVFAFILHEKVAIKNKSEKTTDIPE